MHVRFPIFWGERARPALKAYAYEHKPLVICRPMCIKIFFLLAKNLCSWMCWFKQSEWSNFRNCIDFRFSNVLVHQGQFREGRSLPLMQYVFRELSYLLFDRRLPGRRVNGSKLPHCVQRLLSSRPTGWGEEVTETVAGGNTHRLFRSFGNSCCYSSSVDQVFTANSKFYSIQLFYFVHQSL